MTTGLAERRRQSRRAKARGLRFARMWGLAETHPRIAIRRAVDRQPCSCPLCGNPRRWFGTPTRQELRAAEDEPRGQLL